MKFNPFDHLPTTKSQGKKSIPSILNHITQTPSQDTISELDKIEYCISELKNKGIDITSGYSEWCKFGFVFASLGEGGRQLYHDLSSMHSEYDYNGCDKQFNRNLKYYSGGGSSSSSAITIATFYQQCKEHGINWTDMLEFKKGNKEEANVTTSAKEENGVDLNSILAVRDQLIKRVKEDDIQTIPPLLTLNGDGVIWLNTIVVIMGAKGSHKSRLCEGLCALILNKKVKFNWIGFSHKDLYPKEYYLLYVDTERPLADQYPLALQGIIKRAGYEERPENFDFISLIKEPRVARFKIIQAYLERLRKEVELPIIVVIDVVTDLINNFNDPIESLAFIDWLNLMINEHQITFICVIHENPSQGFTKARGHLGTEIGNKASTELRIGYEKDKKKKNLDLIKLEFPKVRAGRPPEHTYLMWSNQEGGLVVASGEEVALEKSKNKEKASASDIIKALPEILKEPINYTGFASAIVSKYDCSPSIAKDRISELKDIDPTIEDASKQLYALRTRKEGKSTIYFLDKKSGVPFGYKPRFEEKDDDELPF